MTLLEHGFEHMDAGRRARAEKCFRESAGIVPSPLALVNWAMCRLLADDDDGALRILSPVLADKRPQPEGRALAAMAYIGKGDELHARAALRAAVSDFDAGLRSPAARDESTIEEWTAGIGPIIGAAGELGEDRLIQELYGRWPGRDMPYFLFAAAIAAFNLGRYEQAAKRWRQIADQSMRPTALACADIAEQIERGLVPSFRLEYDMNPPDYHNLDAQGRVEVMLSSGLIRARVLSDLLRQGFIDGRPLTEALIRATGSWGIDLGRRLLGARVPLDVKEGAVAGLTAVGVFAPGEAVKLSHEGRTYEVRVNMKVVMDQDARLDAVVAEAKGLSQAGKHDRGLALLDTILDRDGVVYLPAWMAKTVILIQLDRLTEARQLLTILESIEPNRPVVLYNLAWLWMQAGDTTRACEYANRIDLTGTSDEFRDALARLRQLLANPSSQGQSLLRPWAETYRDEEDEKDISLNLTLTGALRRIPVEWLNAIAARYNAPAARLRPERTKVVTALLDDPHHLGAALAAETGDAREALAFVLARGGWCKIQLLTRRFGDQEGDGFWWDELPPTSTVGRLRVLGLLYVGRAHVDGRRYKVAVIPAGLREPLSRLLQDGSDKQC